MFALQIRQARDTVPTSLLQQFVTFEYKVLTNLFTRKTLPDAFSLTFAWRTLNFVYVRYLDFGSLNGLSCQLASMLNHDNVVMDNICPQQDLKIFATHARKSRSKHIQQLFSRLKSFQQVSTDFFSYQMTVQTDYTDDIQYSTHGFFAEDSSVKHILQHKMKDLSMSHRSLVFQDASDLAQHCTKPLTPRDQIDVLNVLSSVNFNTNLRFSTMTLPWQMFCSSAKSVLIQQSVNMSSFLHEVTLPDISSLRKKGRSMKSNRRTSDVGKRIAAFQTAQLRECASILDPQVSRLKVSCSIKDIFRAQLQQRGIIRCYWQDGTQTCICIA